MWDPGCITNYEGRKIKEAKDEKGKKKAKKKVGNVSSGAQGKDRREGEVLTGGRWIEDILEAPRIS